MYWLLLDTNHANSKSYNWSLSAPLYLTLSDLERSWIFKSLRFWWLPSHNRAHWHNFTKNTQQSMGFQRHNQIWPWKVQVSQCYSDFETIYILYMNPDHTLLLKTNRKPYIWVQCFKSLAHKGAKLYYMLSLKTNRKSYRGCLNDTTRLTLFTQILKSNISRGAQLSLAYIPIVSPNHIL